MRRARRFNAITLACLVLGFGARPSLACKNDTSISAGETEFRSRYDTPPPATPTQGFSLAGVIALCAGTAAVAGTINVRRRRKQREGK